MKKNTDFAQKWFVTSATQAMLFALGMFYLSATAALAREILQGM